MAELRKLECQMCGGALEKTGDTTYVCKNCHSKYEIDTTKVSDELIINLNRASANRRKAKFNEAIEDYESILQDAPDNFDAAWGLMLSNKRITFIKQDDELIPVFYDAGEQSIFDNAYYKKAIARCPYPDEYAQKTMQLDAMRNKALGYLKSDDTDILICAESANDRNIAGALATVLKARTGRRVFWSGVSLDRVATYDVEPRLYAAIRHAKLMVVVISSLDALSEVNSERIWKRYIRLAKEGGDKKVILALNDCDIDDVPSDLKHNPHFDVESGNFNQLLDEAEKIFHSEKQEAHVESKPAPQKQSAAKAQPETKPAQKAQSAQAHRAEAACDVSAARAQSSGASVNLGGVTGAGSFAGSISTNPEALRTLAIKIRNYGLSQVSVINECRSSLGRLTSAWDDSHMMQILDELYRLERNCEGRLVDINTFADWLDQKAAVLESRKIIR